MDFQLFQPLALNFLLFLVAKSSIMAASTVRGKRHAVSYRAQELRMTRGKSHITQINAIANEPITFSVDYPTCFPEDISVIWRNNNSTQQVAICKEKLARSHGRFLNRIQCKKKSVTLYNLTLNDNGIFILSSTFPCKDEKEIKQFSLTVYEILPVPHVELEQKKNTPCWCNFTLRCRVPSLAVEYKWAKLVKNSGYQHYKNGSTLWASLKPDSWHEEYLCCVYNPAHNSCATIHVSDICPLSAPGAVTIPCNFLVSIGFWLILLVFVTGAIMVIFGSIFFKRGPRAPDNEISMKNLTP